MTTPALYLRQMVLEADIEHNIEPFYTAKQK